ncbi:MAG: penicillin-binding protein 2 [Anaerolineae bacterium]|nr:penicillin-binding protein 2 [Anaerolineae bacterium]
MQSVNPQQEIINSRLPIVTIGLVVISIALLFSLARFQQYPASIQREFEIREQSNISSVRRLPAVRGVIYDRDGVPLAFNVLQYEVGVSPNLIAGSETARRIAQELGVTLGLDEFEILQSISDPTQSWQQIARPVSAEVGQEIADMDFLPIVINPLSRRSYPQGTLAAPLIGFVIDDNARGAMGVEASYNDQLAGQPIDQTVSNIPFNTPTDFDSASQRGMDIVLTIDRDIQYWVELELQRAVEEQGATGGSIIVMDPRNGEILALANYPTFDPNHFEDVENPDILRNAAIDSVYEPGSIMKVLTIAGAIDLGVITPQWTYNDTGRLEVGGVVTQNWDRNAYGLVDTTQLLINSLNVGAATVSLQMGPELFYTSLDRFGFGQPTRIDLRGEEGGIMRIPGEEGWSESDLAANAYGQAISVTPLQMITAVSAIANDGLIYQPRVVRQIINGDEIRNPQPTVSRAISADTAHILTNMMVRIVEENPIYVENARLEGYSIAGKTGTAQIASPLGYETCATCVIASFIGFFPADDPQVLILVKLDRPRDYWGSVAAAPVFRNVAQRLALLLGIPTDDVRLGLVNAGGVINDDGR